VPNIKYWLFLFKKYFYLPFEKWINFDRIRFALIAEVAELADALRSGRSEH
jgi:hypothetical protein